MVNPYHVKQTKELSDNNQTNNDQKDSKIIAMLVKDGCFSYPYVPTGVYAYMRILNNERLQSRKKIVICKNQIERWLSIYFPEHKTVFKDVEAVSSIMVLKVACLPLDIVALGLEAINLLWRAAKLKAVGLKKAERLVEAVKSSIGQSCGLKAAKMQMQILLQEYEMQLKLDAQIMAELEALMPAIIGSQELLKIKGIGIKSVVGFIAEVGGIGRFSSPKQIQKLAGLSLKENSSGKYKRETTISCRDRTRLRGILFNAVIPLLATNEGFQAIHAHYAKRKINPLKRKQSVVAICCKLIRIFYAVMKHRAAYDEHRMLRDIKWYGNIAA